MEAALTLNKIFLSDQKTPFSPFLQSPISNTLDFNYSSDKEVPPNSAAADGGDEVNISFERGENSESKI